PPVWGFQVFASGPRRCMVNARSSVGRGKARCWISVFLCIPHHPQRRQKVSESECIRVMLVDDHAVVRAGYRFLLENVPDIEVIAEAGSGEEAVAVFSQHSPDILVVD